MKTTVEIDDSLLVEAKAVAARRRTSLKALIDHALRRELAPLDGNTHGQRERFEMGPLGFLVLKRRPGETVSLEDIAAIETAQLDEELRSSLPGQRA